MSPAVSNTVRVGAWVLVGILAALGLVTAGLTLLMPAAVAAAIGACVGWALAEGRSRRGPLGLAAACALGVPAVAGLAFVTGAATLVAAPAIVAALLWTRAKPTAAVPSAASLAHLSNAELARQWHASYTALAMARDPRSLELICALRRRQLDEIERRAPGGYHRWIESGSWVRGDSAPFLGG